MVEIKKLTDLERSMLNKLIEFLHSKEMQVRNYKETIRDLT